MRKIEEMKEEKVTVLEDVRRTKWPPEAAAGWASAPIALPSRETSPERATRVKVPFCQALLSANCSGDGAPDRQMARSSS